MGRPRIEDEEIKYIRLYVTQQTVTKMSTILAMEHGDTVWVIWQQIQVQAAWMNSGRLMVDRFPITPAVLARMLGRSIADTEYALAALEQVGLIEWESDMAGNAIIALPGFEDDQLADWRAGCAKRKGDREKYEQEKQEKLAKAAKGALPEPKESKNAEFEAEFEEIWKTYPNKKGKANARKAYIKARRDGATREEIETGIEAYKADIKARGTAPEYIKHGSTWFNQRCWEDEYSDTSGSGEAEEAWVWALKMLYSSPDGYREQASDRIKQAIKAVGGSSWIKQHEEDAHKKFLEIY